MASSSFISCVSSFMITISQIEIRPPGFKARNISLYTLHLLSDILITQFEIQTSAVLSATGRFSISPRRNSTFHIRFSFAILLAFESISGAMSTPMARPLLPTVFPAIKQSSPVPDPRSSTISPG